MEVAEKKQILERYYFNTKNPAAFAGAQKLFNVLDKKYPGTFTVKFIQQWLNDQDAYSLQKSRRHRFKTASVRVSGIGEQLDIDLLSMVNLAEDNDGVRFLLCAIDILSRQLWVQPLKNKNLLWGNAYLGAKLTLGQCLPYFFVSFFYPRESNLANVAFNYHGVVFLSDVEGWNTSYELFELI